MGKYVDLSQTVTASYYDEEHEEWRSRRRTIEDLLDDLCDSYTTTDAVPVVHGRWNRSDDVYESAVCSVCGWDTTEPSWEHIKEWFEFCPYCGAKMDGNGNG